MITRRAFLATRRRQRRFPHEDLEAVSEQLPAFSPEFANQLDSAQVLSALARVEEGVDQLRESRLARDNEGRRRRK